MTEVIAAVVGFALSEARQWWAQRGIRSSLWASMLAELEICRERCDTHFKGNVMAPLYRISTDAFSTAIPALIAAGALNHDELIILINCFSRMQNMNRGLDLAAAIASSPETDRDTRLKLVHGRNRLCSARLILPPKNGENDYSAARRVLESRLRN